MPSSSAAARHAFLQALLERGYCTESDAVHLHKKLTGSSGARARAAWEFVS